MELNTQIYYNNIELKKPDYENFRLSNQKYLLVYKGHIEEDNIKECLYRKSNMIKECYVKIADACSDYLYNHTYVIIDFGKVINSRNKDYLNYEEKRPFIFFIRKKNEWELIIEKYIGKNQNKIDEDDINKSEIIINNILKVNNTWEKKYDIKKIQIPDIKLNKWQIELQDLLINKETNNNDVYWYYGK